MFSITLCNLNQLTQQKHSQTSSGIAANKVILDRDSGKIIEIQYPLGDLIVSGSSLSFRTSWQSLSMDKLMLLIKCLLIVQSLPEIALEEAAKELNGIFDFYASRLPLDTNRLPTSSDSNIKGKLKAVQVRPSIVLDA